VKPFASVLFPERSTNLLDVLSDGVIVSGLFTLVR